MTRPILLDNTVLTNLALVNRADLVTRLWGKAACTTPTVMVEYLKWAHRVDCCRLTHGPSCLF